MAKQDKAKQAAKREKPEQAEKYHWADSIAEQLCKTEPKSKEKFVCAAGITPSGAVHIGNFREMITVELVSRALKSKNKQVKFIYSWDDFDRFRKIPVGMPKPELLQDSIGIAITKAPDTFGCHKSYAEHFEKEVEQFLPAVGISPEFIYEADEYGKCRYADEIKFVLENMEKIKAILSKYKAEPITGHWWPVQVYCEKCMKDTTRILSWDNNSTLKYECDCGYEGRVDFSKKGIVKLPWRIDWPMRWRYYKVDFEPGGKEHSTPGGSYTTASEIIKEIYKENPPFYQKYDFIIVKGKGGKMSKSLGNVITLKDCLEIYEPQILRYMFVKARPNTEFAIAFDNEVLKIYSEYDELEQQYFSKKLDRKQKRIYELSQVDAEKKPKRIFSPSFRQLVEIVQIKDTKGILEHYKQEINAKEDEARTMKRAELAKNWLKQAPEEFIFRIQDKPDNETIKKLGKNNLEALKELAKFLAKDITEQHLVEEFRRICDKHKIEPKDFFKGAYLVLLGKEQGPRLSSLIILEKEKVRKLLGAAG